MRAVEANVARSRICLQENSGFHRDWTEYVQPFCVSTLQRRGRDDHIIGIPRIVDAGEPHRIGWGRVGERYEGMQHEEDAEDTQASPPIASTRENVCQQHGGSPSGRAGEVKAP